MIAPDGRAADDQRHDRATTRGWRHRADHKRPDQIEVLLDAQLHVWFSGDGAPVIP